MVPRRFGPKCRFFYLLSKSDPRTLLKIHFNPILLGESSKTDFHPFLLGQSSNRCEIRLFELFSNTVLVHLDDSTVIYDSHKGEEGPTVIFQELYLLKNHQLKDKKNSPKR